MWRSILILSIGNAAYPQPLARCRSHAGPGLYAERKGAFCEQQLCELRGIGNDEEGN